jgi:hypothetical protein
MREVIQCLIDWLDSIPSDDKPHLVLRALAEESIKKADFKEEDKRRFTGAEIAAAAKENPFVPNKWIDWRRSVLPYWESREHLIIEFARKQRLEFYPKPDRIESKGGRGRETTYRIKAELLPKTSDDEQLEAFQPQPNRATEQTSVHYEIAENGEVKPTWGAQWLLHNGQIRLSSWHIWVILIWLLILGGGTVALSVFSWIVLSMPKPVTTRELAMFLSIFAFPYAIWILAIRPWWRLFDERIVPAPELLVALKEKPAQMELFRDGDLRLIRLVRYSAPCPVCGATIYLDDGSPDYPRRMVGRCYESPREHVFSFDRVTRKGTFLRSPI